MKQTIGYAQIKKALQTACVRIALLLMVAFTSSATISGNPIPVSNADVPGDNSDMLITMLKIIGELGAVFIAGGAIWVLWQAISGIVAGYSEFRKLNDFAPLKNAIFGSAFMIVVAAAVLALMVIVVAKLNS